MSDSSSTRRNPFVIVGGFALLGLLAAAVLLRPNWFGIGADSAEPAAIQSLPAPTIPEVAVVRDSLGGVAVGAPAPDFSLTDLNGQTVALHDFAGHPVMLNFWATWCAPCRIEMPEIEASLRAQKDAGFVVLALNQAEDPDTVREYMATLQLAFVPLMDTDTQVADLYGVAGIYPTSYFIAPDGTVSAVHRGPATQGQIDDYLKAMAAQQQG